MSAEELTCGKALNLEEKSISKTNFKIILTYCQLAEFSRRARRMEESAWPVFTTCLCDKLFRFSNFVIFLFVSLVFALLLVFVNLFLCHHLTNHHHGIVIVVSVHLLSL